MSNQGFCILGDEKEQTVAIALALLQQRMEDVIRMVSEMRTDMKSQAEEFKHSLRDAENKMAADVLRHSNRTDERFEAIESTLNKKVDQSDFKLVKAVVFGFVGLVLVAVASALIATVVLKPSPSASAQHQPTGIQGGHQGAVNSNLMARVINHDPR